MLIEILSTGEEIRSGAVVDSNAAYIARQLEQIDMPAARHTSVGDELDILVNVLSEISQRAQFAIVTGGLGPTEDDRTIEAAAKTAGVGLELFSEALRAMEIFLKKRNLALNPSNRKQAYLPIGSEVFMNPIGTAPGFALTIKDCVFFFLPGVPPEMKQMLAQTIIPRLMDYRGRNAIFQTVKLRLFGLPESGVNERLKEFETVFPKLSLRLRTKFPEIQITLCGSETQMDRLQNHVKDAQDWVLEKLAPHVFSSSGEPMASVIGDLLRKQGATLAIAESCTGGLISHWITNVAGSSDYFIYTAVVYADVTKANTLGVSSDTLEKYGAVHERTAQEMARGARDKAGSTFGLATTGIAGPGGGSHAKPVGTICIGLAGPSFLEGYRFTFNFHDRGMHKRIFAMKALDMLRHKLLAM